MQCPTTFILCLSIPPKYSVAFVVGFLKGEDAAGREFYRELLHERRMSGLHFLGSGLLREHSGAG